MNTLTRWEPLRKLDELQNRLATLLGRHPIRKNDEKKEALTVAEWAYWWTLSKIRRSI